MVCVSGCSVAEDSAGACAEAAFWGWGALVSGAVGPIRDRLMDHLFACNQCVPEEMMDLVMKFCHPLDGLILLIRMLREAG
jgi:hypothetical protein